MNKSANLYTAFPVTEGVFEFANVSINIILLLNMWPMQHIGPAVCAPVVIMYPGLNFKYRYKLLNEFSISLNGYVNIFFLEPYNR